MRPLISREALAGVGKSLGLHRCCRLSFAALRLTARGRLGVHEGD